MYISEKSPAKLKCKTLCQFDLSDATLSTYRSTFMRFWKTINSFVILLHLLLINTTISEAQDDHYWSQQYGAESTLLGGAMVGGISDNSAVYYNPGALAFIPNPSLSIDANVYKVDKILIGDGAGNGINLNSAQLSIYPQIISGMLNLFKTEKFKFSYTLLTRNHSNVLMNTRYTSQASQNDPENPVPSATSFVGAFDYINQIEELWFGIGAGYSVSEKLGLGATLFTSYRGQSYQLTNYVREINYVDSNYVFRTQTNDEAVKYTAIRVLAKFGLSYIAGRLKYGLTLTTPSIGIFGRGSIQRENSNIVVSENPADLMKNFMIADRKTDAKTIYKHPLSIALGVDYRSPKTRLAVSAEYFSRISSYHLMQPDAEPFLYPPTYLDSVDFKPMIDNYLHIENASKSVFNVAVGFSHAIYKQLTLLLGASTDFSSYDLPNEANELLHGFSNWDIYHLSAGMSYHKQKHIVSFGLSYAITPSRHIPPYTVINQTPEITNNALMSAKSYSFVLGYTYYFARAE